MNAQSTFQTIHTVPERCRVCYTCVRECPAKAIRIVDGQAKVIHERCISCGNCVRVCSQKAKQVVDSVPRAKSFLADTAPVAAIIAPSFPAEFAEWDAQTLVGMIRALGFEWVSEVAFGADLTAREYRRLLSESEKPMIATTCPAVVLYVEKYFPDLLGDLAPVVSPMVAMSRVMRELHGEGIRIVFIGPCTAKKCEGVDTNLPGEVDDVLTFAELRQMIAEAEIDPQQTEPSDFDPPFAGSGALFPLCGGMLQAADIEEDLVECRVVSANGAHFVTAIKDYGAGDMETQLLEVLACDGCVMGAGMSSDASLFRRRSRVSNYVSKQLQTRDPAEWQQQLDRFASVSLVREYSNMDQRLGVPAGDDVTEILQRMGKFKQEDELNCGACGYTTCREHAVAIHKGLAESEMCLPYTIDRLNETIGELAQSHDELATTQEALMQSERLASMGQLAAGIAHEVNNPLGVVLMYAHLLLDDLAEDSKHKQDAAMIAEQADRCKKIVAGLLHFARQNKVLREATNIRDLIERAVRAVVKPPAVKLTVVHDLQDAVAAIDVDQMLQVLTNLFSNAYAAMPDGGELRVTTSDTADTILIAVSDTGVGISPDNRGRIFEPFFTTKQIGKGTGLGLAVTYGIIKMHRGDVSMETNDDPAEGPTGTTFRITVPRREED